MADRDTPPGDELALRDNGTIRLMLAGKGATWRRPLFGEYKKFREMLIEASEITEQLKNEIEATVRASLPTDADAKALAKLRAGAEIPVGYHWTAAQRLRFELADAEGIGGWAVDVWRVLTDKEPPTVDELPVWMTTASFSQSVFEHWRQVPLAGSSSR